MSCDDPGAQLRFPVQVHFRIICHRDVDARVHLEIALADLGLHEPLEAGNVSRGGSYQTFQLSCLMPSRERMAEVDAALRAVPGVKMLL